MRPLSVRSARPRPGVAGLVALATLCLLAAWPSEARAASDALWHIVSRCLLPTAAGYCATCQWPVEGACGARGCAATTEIWAETPEFAAIRDLKMCGCPAGFVHGLALPRRRVSGVEDPARPAAIWAFAWDVARSRIADDEQIALAVNPVSRRTQDQLHVHLVRLRPDARRRFASQAFERTPALDLVWTVAARRAAAAGFADYGVLVAREGSGPGFLVVLAPVSPEEEFTIGTCR